jgi:pyruvate carboxylase subunit B
MIAAMSEVVRRGGFSTSVTPVSQFYFQQAFNNVMFGPWEKIADGYGKMVLGYFGRTPVEPDPEIVKIAADQLGLEPTKLTPLEINDADPTKGVEPARKLLQEAGLEETDENIFIAATCKEKGIAFLKGEATVGVRKTMPEEAPSAAAAPEGYTVTVNGQRFAVALSGSQAVVNGKSYEVDIQDGIEDAPQAAAPPTATATAPEEADGTPVKAAMPGAVIRIEVNIGDPVQTGDTLLVLEAMKMEVEVKAPVAGTVASVDVTVGDQVANGQKLAGIR